MPISNIAPGLTTAIVQGRMKAAQQQKEIDARPGFWERVGERAVGQVTGGLVDAGGALIKEHMPSAKQKRAIEKAAEARADDLHMMKTQGPVWQTERLMELVRQGKISREEAMRSVAAIKAGGRVGVGPGMSPVDLSEYDRKIHRTNTGPADLSGYDRKIDTLLGNAIALEDAPPPSNPVDYASRLSPPTPGDTLRGGPAQVDARGLPPSLRPEGLEIDPEFKPLASPPSYNEYAIKGSEDWVPGSDMGWDKLSLPMAGSAERRELDEVLKYNLDRDTALKISERMFPTSSEKTPGHSYNPSMERIMHIGSGRPDGSWTGRPPEGTFAESDTKKINKLLEGGEPGWQGVAGKVGDEAFTDDNIYRQITENMERSRMKGRLPAMSARAGDGSIGQARRVMEKVTAPRTALDKVTKKLEKEIAKAEKPKSFRQQWKEHSKRLGELQYYKQVAAQKAAEQEFKWKTKPAAIKSLSEAISKMDPKGRKGRVLRQFVVDLDNYDDVRSPADIFKKAGAKAISLYGGGKRFSGNAAKKWLDGYVYSKKTERAHWAALVAKDLGVTVDGLYPMVKTAEGHATVMNAFSKVKELTGEENAIVRGVLAKLSNEHSYWLERFGKETDIKKLMAQGAFDNAIGVQQYIAEQKRKGVSFKMSMKALIDSKVVKTQPGTAGGDVSYHLRDTQGRSVKFSPTVDWQSTVTNAIPTGQGEVPKPKASTYNKTTPISGPVTSADLEKYGSKMKARFNSKRNNQMLSLGPKEYLDIWMSEGGMNRVQAARKTKEAFAAQVRKLRAGK